MNRPPALRAELLECRTTPAAFGTPWPDGQNLTLSFAPNGTSVGSGASDLNTLLSKLGPSAKMDVLRAFQTWAVQGNINIGLVGDTGAAFGTGGAVQGDSRFGDIRVGGTALGSDVLAVTAPYNLYDNYSGDVVVNTAAKFGAAGNDLFTVLLQEAGHSLGVGNSADLASAMYEYYRGARAGLSAGDVASIQALYGARTPDKYEGAAGNNTTATAATLPLLIDPIAADLSGTRDVDVYKFTPGLLTNSVTVNLKAAGLSLLTAKVELLDASGRVLATASASDPTKNDLTLSSSNIRAGNTYYVRVSGATGDVFGVGSYELSVKQNSLLTALTGLVGQLLDETGLNDTLFTATSLVGQVLSVGPQTEYKTDASFGSKADTDYYQVAVPAAGAGQSATMVVTVWGKNGAALNPWLEAYDKLGRKITGEVLSADGATTTIQFRGLKPGDVYYIKAASDSGSAGKYTLTADLRSAPVQTPAGPSGTLDASHAAAGGAIKLSQTGQVHFVLSADGKAASGRSVELVVTDAAGKVVARLTVPVGRGRSLDVMLPAGTYRATVRATDTGSPIAYKLGMTSITDPTGAQAADPAGSPEETNGPSDTFEESGDTGYGEQPSFDDSYSGGGDYAGGGDTSTPPASDPGDSSGSSSGFEEGWWGTWYVDQAYYD